MSDAKIIWISDVEFDKKNKVFIIHQGIECYLQKVLKIKNAEQHKVFDII